MLDTVEAITYIQTSFHTMVSQAHATGRTTAMINSLIKYIKSIIGEIPGRILVIGYSMQQLKDIQRMVEKALTLANIAYTSEIMFIKVGNHIIRFDAYNRLSKYAELQPTPKRFVDHFAEECIVSEKLQQIKQDIKNLRTGE